MCKNTRMNWDDLRLLRAVGAQGSFSGAAAELGLDHSSVSRRMRAFEKRLGVGLFERLPGGLGLTAAGAELFEAAQRMAEDATAAERRVTGRDSELRGEIRFATVDATARKLMPVLREFLALYPGIRLEINLSQQLANLSRREADVVLRATNTPPETYVGRRVAGHVFPVFAAASLVARIGADAPLEAFPWVCWENGLGRDWMTRHAPAARIACQVNTALGMEEAVRAGIGIGHLAAFGADGDPDFLRLRPPAEDLALDIWLLIHPDLRRNARIRAFTDFMAAALSERRDLIEGRRPL